MEPGPAFEFKDLGFEFSAVVLSDSCFVFVFGVGVWGLGLWFGVGGCFSFFFFWV